MSDFDPGPGWRELEPEERYEGPRREQLCWTAGDRIDIRYWVRDVPLPALPIAPYTVALVSFNDDQSGVYLLGADGFWHSPFDHGVMTHLNLARVTSFEILSEPRAVTAKALLDEFETYNWDTSAKTVEVIATSFGVKS